MKTSISLENDKLVLRFSHTPLLVGNLEHWQYGTFVAAGMTEASGAHT
jgi:hypothetical protein